VLFSNRNNHENREVKKILIIYGHPVRDTFSDDLAGEYLRGAIDGGAEIRQINLNDLEFNLNLSGGYRIQSEPEEDIIRAQQDILWCDHMVFIYPNWWATFPAMVKGFIDRTFLPGFAFRYTKGSSKPERLLRGKSARIIVTMDNPVWYYRIVYHAPGIHAMKKATLEFCGVRPVNATLIGSVRKSTPAVRKKWLKRLYRLGILDS